MCKIVSVIIPVYNEERYIENCIQSLLEQDYPQNKMEFLFLDGRSTDKTVQIIDTFLEQYSSLIRIIENPNRTQSYAMNIGIMEAKGKYILRLDAHADYDKHYISECVRLLETGLYQNVGGVADTKARSKFGEVVALMMSSRFGVGNSQFRTSDMEGPVDTVPFGAFSKDYLVSLGGFDERLNRNEDNEINYRIRKNGGVVYLSPKIRFTYYCRDTLKGILSMAFQNGKWTLIASRLCPGSMSLRHLIPLLFVLSIIALIVLGHFFAVSYLLLMLELALFFSLAFLFSIKTKADFKMILQLLLLFPAFHISYGCGSIFGIITVIRGV